MADPKGFLTVRERETAPRRPVPVRIRDWHEVYERPADDVLRRQAGRCMDCGIPFCHNGCPLGNLIPEWNDLTRRGDWREAIEQLHATNNFPEFTGKLCPAPCEAACVLGINQDPVTIKQVEESIIDRAWEEGWVVPSPERLTGKTVAVIGSGPAGLAAAQQLTRAGHTVAVYERDDALGGLMRYGVPEYKMEKRHIDRRVAQMRAEGTRFRTGVDVGGDGPGAVDAARLAERYDAVVLAVGALQPRELDVPGRALRGVHQAMDYLPRGNREALGLPLPEGQEPVSAEGKDVVIVGAGDTGADCLGTVMRQGPRSVVQLAIGPQPPADRSGNHPWPTYPLIFRTSTAHEEAEHEGGQRVYTASTTALVDDGAGAVAALRLQEVVRNPDRTYEVVPGSERELPAQLVLLALGFSGVERTPLVEQLGLQVGRDGALVRDAGWQTSRPGTFVVGDAGRGASLIVWAIAEGRAAAAAVDAHLSGRPSTLPAPVAPTTRPLVV